MGAATGSGGVDAQVNYEPADTRIRTRKRTKVVYVPPEIIEVKWDVAEAEPEEERQIDLSTEKLADGTKVTLEIHWLAMQILKVVFEKPGGVIGDENAIQLESKLVPDGTAVTLEIYRKSVEPLPAPGDKQTAQTEQS